MKESNYDNYLTLKPAESELSIDDIKDKLLHRFYFLKEDKKFQKFYGEYEDTQDNKIMVEIWDKIIRYLLEEIFHCFAFKISDLKKYLTIYGKEPLCLNNILQKLRFRNIYISDEDLKNENYYKMNFPDLYPPTQGFLTNIYNTVTSYTSFIPIISKSDMSCCREKEEKETIENEDIRKDLSEKEKCNNIPENSILFNYEIFKNHCNALLMVIKDILHDNDSSIITKYNLLKNIRENYIENDDNCQGGKYKLRYGDQYINISIHYLEKIKKIIIFNLKSADKIEFIKVSTNKDDSITEQDKEEATLILSKEAY